MLFSLIEPMAKLVLSGSALYFILIGAPHALQKVRSAASERLKVCSVEDAVRVIDAAKQSIQGIKAEPESCLQARQ